MHLASLVLFRFLDARPQGCALHHRIGRCACLVLLLAFAPSSRLLAQGPPAPPPLSNMEDARTLPAGTFRLRASTAWTRYDAFYGGRGDSVRTARPIGEAFSVKDLGARDMPLLARAEGALRVLTGNANFAVNVGRLVATADSRVYTTPISLEYGFTGRLTVGAMVPVVQTHSTVFVELNPRALANNANVGPNPAQFSGNASARATNLAVYNALNQASADLNNALRSCASNPTGPICSQQTQAIQARVASAAYAAAIKELYGIDANSGSPFVPTADLQSIVAQRLAQLDATYQTLLGRSYLTTRPVGAVAVAALLQLEQVATDPGGIAFDSLGSPDRIGIGDVEVSAAYRLFDTFGDSTTTGSFRLRAAARGVVRLPTGRPSNLAVPFEIGTGTGQTSAEAAGIVDVRFRPRITATFAGQYTTYFGSAKVHRVPGSEFTLFPLDAPLPGRWHAGNAVQIEATPRFLLTDFFSVNGQYTLRRQEGGSYRPASVTTASVFAASTEQRVGFGIGYSSLARYVRGKTNVPLEMFYSHLETFAARGGLTPKYTREQLELRLYYRLRRGVR